MNSADGITPIQSMAAESATHAARQSQLAMTNCTAGAMTIMPLDDPKNTSPTALPLRLRNHLPTLADAPIWIRPWSAILTAVKAM